MADDVGRPSADSRLVDFPEALETFLARVDELKIVFGPSAAPRVDQVAEALRAALAARACGDVRGMTAHVGQAMKQLSAIAAHVDSAEGGMMRAVAERFLQALGRGTLGEAKEAAEIMRDRSGSVLTPRPSR
jgi:hypothetical protein